jgi:hypothetical protein
VRIVWVLLALLSFPGIAAACSSSVEPTFDRMIRDSLLIVRGQVLRDTADTGDSQEPVNHQSDIRVERIYKGTAPGSVRVNWKKYSFCARARLDLNAFGLFFLRARGSDFELVEEEFGGIVNISRWEDDAPGLDPSTAIERDLKMAIRNDSGRDLLRDLLLLSSLRRSMDTSVLHALFPASDPVLNAAVHLALLKLHDYSRLEISGRMAEAVANIESFTLPAQEAERLSRQAVFEIRNIEDPRQLPTLQQFTLSSDVWLREGATYALRHFHDLSNVRYLIRLIEVPSRNTKIQAIRGLAELLKPGIEGYGWIPNTPLDGRNVTEEEVIARWQSWWAAEGESEFGM